MFLTRNTLWRTLTGNRCEYLTITTKGEPEQIKSRKGIFLSARVHPGETGASYMIEGIINFLTSNTIEAQILRDKFVFKIIPMLNPDGVIHGNYRCSLAGCDLNRRWRNPSSVLHPPVFKAKELCLQFAAQRDLLLYCDLHGHSRRKNLFIYGNTSSEIEEDVKLFPFIMSKICEPFWYRYCKFRVQRHKESTARVAMWKNLPIFNVFTLEASFWGASIGTLRDMHFRSKDYHYMGHKLCQAILVYAKIECPSLTNYLKNEEEEVENKQDDEKNNYDDLSVASASNQSHSLPRGFYKINNLQKGWISALNPTKHQNNFIYVSSSLQIKSKIIHFIGK